MHLSCIYTNIDGLNGRKGAELDTILSSVEPHVIFLTETKMTKSQVTSQFFDCRKYVIFRKERTTGRGGGVQILIRNDLWSREVTDLQSDDIEVVMCELVADQRKLLLACVYRPPNTSQDLNKKLCEMVTEMCHMGYDQVLICGDFNFGKIDWENGSPGVGEQAEFFDACQDGFLYQHVTEFTRARGFDNPSLLDLVLTQNPMEIEDMRYQAPIGKSDHCVLAFKMLLEKGHSATMNSSVCDKRNFHKTNFTLARQMIREIDWNQELNGKSVDDAWDTFLYHYNEVVAKTVPLYQVNGRKYKKKWMTKGILMLIQKKDELWKLYRKNKKSKKRLMRYKKIRNQVTAAIKKAKCSFEYQLAKEVRDNPRAFFAYARSRTSIREELKTVRKPDGEMTSNLLETCEVLNCEFEKVFTKHSCVQKPILGHAARQQGDLLSIDLSTEDVEKALNALKSPSAPGPDGVNPTMLKECSGVFCLPLYKLFNLSLSSGKLPSDWRKANVKPIYKKGCKTDSLNYRPVSLTSVVCKVLEKVIKQKVVGHLEGTNFFSRHQHGFRTGMSCLTQLLEYFSDIENSLDEGDCVDAVYLDCRKAFDTVPHHQLLEKIGAAGIGGEVKDWIGSFLEDRVQRVVIGGSHSTWRRVWSGVPQGSVLGPTLFLIYVNDLLENIDSKGKLFADDAKIYRQLRTEEDRKTFQQDLDKLHAWSTKWGMRFNESKCKAMHIGRKNPRWSYTLGGAALQETEREKDLGVWVTSNFKAADQVASAAAAANSMLWMIRKAFTCLDEKTFPPLYKALVRPRMEHAVQAWSPYLRKDIDRLERVQRRGTKLIPSLAALTYEERLKRLNLTSLEDRRRRGDMIETFKILKGIDKIEDNFLERDKNPRTRGNALKLTKTHHRTQRRLMFFSSRIVNHWNELPDWVVQSPSTTAFKNRYDKYISKQ